MPKAFPVSIGIHISLRIKIRGKIRSGVKFHLTWLTVFKSLKFWLLAGTFAFLGKGFAQTVDVGIEQYGDIESFVFQALGDEAVITTLDSFPVEIARLNTLEKVKFANVAGSLKIYKDGKLLGTFGPVQIWNQDAAPRQNLILEGKSGPFTVDYAGHLKVRPFGRFLKVINQVHLEEYAVGVIYAEAGHHKSLDFFKVQAVSARTYALRHYGKHGREGFDICDQTHCQAYKGIPPKADLIQQAVDESRGEVIVYNHKDLIEAVFSANCGGFTANSEDVWVASVDYLRAMPDYNFCEGSINHAWHVTIPKLDFLAKLGRYQEVDARSFEIIPDVSGRVKRVLVNDNEKLAISGEEMRRLFKFKSSKFYIFDSNSLLFVEGAGFGHGVGMCQDGAYYLSQQGMDYQRIVKHYYQGVEIIPYEEVRERLANLENNGE